MSWDRIGRHPVFVGGHRKCGTTLLVSLLDGHDELFVYPGETAFFYKFFPVYESEAYSSEEKIQQMVSLLEGLDQKVAALTGADSQEKFSLEDTLSRFRTDLKGTDLSPRACYDVFYRTIWSMLSTKPSLEKAWIEKTTSIEIYAQTLFDWYPEARFIHVLRDPRDNYAAVKAGWESSYRFQFDSKERLLQSVIDRGFLGMKQAAINQALYGTDHYLILKYEDLVSDPERNMKTIATFLGITFVEGLLKPTFCGAPWKGNSYEGKSFSGISDQNAGRWADRITGHEARVLEFYFKDLLNHYGYELDHSDEVLARAAAEHYKWFNYAQPYSIQLPAPGGEKSLA